MRSVIFIALATVALGAAGCSKTPPNSGGRSSAANDPLKAAFVVAFPAGDTEKNESGATLTYTAKKLVPLDLDGGLQALISEGSQGDDAGHIQLGALRITYLNSNGDAFTRPQPRIQETLDGNGFGQPPDWKIIHIHNKPAVRLEYKYSNQGCTDTTVTVYLLQTDGINLDKRASKPMKEVCEDLSDPASDFDAGTPADTGATAGTSDDSNATSTPTAADSDGGR